ncbi:MAG: RnfABCDGE type electron transport complex subunit D [Lachnospira sp.]
MSDLFNVSTNPHVRSKDTTQTIMRDVCIALAPASIFGILNFGLDALIRIVVGILVCVASEALFQYFMKKKITVSDLSAAVTGLLIALNIPSTLNIGYEIVGCVFAIIVVKQLFGGLGQNFMNPALAARCFLLIGYTGPMTSFATNNSFLVDSYSGATPLAILKPGAEVAAGTATPELLDMFIGTTAGVIGETSVICLLLGAIYLLVRKVISWRIPVTYIATFAVLIFFFAPEGNNFDLMYLAKEICGGGLILGAFFMATDYVTSPITPNGKLLFGLCLGLLTFIFRMFGGSAEGVSYAIIFCNLLVPLIEKVTVPKSFGKKKPEKKEKEANK